VFTVYESNHDPINSVKAAKEEISVAAVTNILWLKQTAKLVNISFVCWRWCRALRRQQDHRSVKWQPGLSACVCSRQQTTPWTAA